MRWDTLFIEIISVVLFVWGYLKCRNSGTGRGLEFLMIGVYGLILEELDMFIFKSYHYSPDFLLTVFKAPVCIALLWAVILAGSMSLSDHLGLPMRYRPFMDAILAVWIDLALDAIAIRLEYWTWVIPMDQGWFGVPAGNLYAWMWVAFAYSFLARFVRAKVKQDKRWVRAYFALPVFAYMILFVTMSAVSILGNTFSLDTQAERLVVFYAQFLVFLVIVVTGWMKRKGRDDGAHSLGFWVWSRYFMHIYFLGAYFILKLYSQLPVLGVMALIILGVEVMFHRLVLKPVEAEVLESQN